MERKYCSFPVRVTKAWEDPVTKKKRIAGVASDDKLDWYRERFAVEALNDMVTASKSKKALKPEEGLVDIFETHRESFGFGYVVDGGLERNLENNSTEYHFEAEMKDGWVQGAELWEDIKAKRIDKQLSVGGWIPNWETDYAIETDTFVDDEGNEMQIEVGVIKRFKLEHIAVTPPDGAANPRTHFTTAKSKDVGYTNGAVYKSANDEGYQKRFAALVNKGEDTEKQNKNFLEGLKKVMREVVDEVFGEREDKRMTRIEKATKFAEDLRKLMEESPEDFTPEVMKSLGITIGSATPVEPVVAGITEEVLKSKVDGVVADIEAKLEEIKKSIPTIPEVPAVPKIEDVTKAVQEALAPELAAIGDRLKAIEDATPGSQNEAAVVEKTNGEGAPEGEPEAVANTTPSKYGMWA